MAYHAGSGVHKTLFKMPAYSSPYNPSKKDIDGGDKIILHTGILNNLLQRFGERPMPHPLIFEVQNLKNRRITHCGVLEFSAEQATAFMPEWMMLNLELTEGQEIQLKLKELPLATALVLQPLKWTFGQIPTPKIALEHALASFTALTAGDTISIRVAGQSHSLHVVDVSPPTKQIGHRNAACVVNAHLEVDFLPPLEEEPESEQATVLELGEVRAGESAAAGTYRYFRVKTLDSGLAFQVEATALSGDPELVVSTSTNKPEVNHCSWHSISAASSSAAAAASASSNGVGRKRVVTVSPTAPGFIVGWYYIGVYAYGADTSFDVVAREVAPVAEDGRAATGSSVGSLSSSDPNAKLCSNCHQYISQKAYSLHQAQCARMNVYCPQCAKAIRKSELPTHAHCDVCNVVLHPDEKEKHMDLLHKSIPCSECGEPIDPAGMQAHKRDECKMRPAHCRWCDMEMAYNLLFEHQQRCGATTILCDRCSKPVSRKGMDIHLAVDHGINLSYRPDDRSSLGSSVPMPTAQQLAEERRQMAAFQKITKEMETGAGPPPTEDELLARAVAASLEPAVASASPAAAASSYPASSAYGAAIPSPPAPFVRTQSSEDAQDMALQAALMESSGAAVPPAAASPDMASPAPSGIFDGVARDEDWEEAADDDDAHMQAADEVDTWSDGEEAATAATHAKPDGATGSSKRMAELDCPYCGAHHQTEAAQLAHMATCAEVE